MGTFGPFHLLIVAALALLLFGGRGKLSSIMGDAAKGVRAFREGLNSTEDAAPAPVAPLPAPQAERDRLHSQM